MKRHLIPRAGIGTWTGDALTPSQTAMRPLPPLKAAFARAFGRPEVEPYNDEASGRYLRVQWLGLYVEIVIGRVS